MCPRNVEAIQTLTSGKRNDLVDLGVVQFQRAGPVGIDDRRASGAFFGSSGAQFQFDSAQYKLSYRVAFVRRLLLKRLIERVGDVHCSPHGSILPYLWLVRDLETKPAGGCGPPATNSASLQFVPESLAGAGGGVAGSGAGAGAGVEAAGAGLSASGRFNSSVNSVPAGNVAEPCLVSQ